MTLASTKLTAPNGLIELRDRETKSTADFLTDVLYVKRSRKRDTKYPELSNFLSNEIVASVTADVDTLINLPEMQHVVGYSITEPDRDYRYHVTLVLDKSTLVKARKIYKELLKTSSDLSKLSGKMQNRTGYYEYKLVVDCNDGGLPSWGIHRLARLVITLDKLLESRK